MALRSGPSPSPGCSQACCAYLLNQARLHPLLADLPPVLQLSTRDGRHHALRAVIDLLDSEVTNCHPGADAVVPALLDTLLLYLLRAWFEDQCTRTKGGWAAALQDQAIGAALSVIHTGPAHPWTVEELGARAGLSRAAFARRFTTLVGQPPLAYLTWWRMTTAGRLLRESDAPLRVVAGQAGYVSEFAFAKAFKREYALSPGRYRALRAGPAGRRNGSARAADG
ncbi:AraC family transcriptional regulator [Streptomyces sp. H10-C2]|nr:MULTISPECIES: AraC family transcriptional regulator [unclassified Streptomyces]MDJ0340358.1 AraC family transcriptional regulator [Streptomyces sp. PH10-H1]MDJ0368194.1 AraC family transcriptional regulator [Streptomyces sp. H10-C2]